MRKIIGLQTPHYAPNYGAKLQALAIAEAIRQLGFQVEYINRRPLCAYMYKNRIDRFLKAKEEQALSGLTEFELSYLQPQTMALYNNQDFEKLDLDKYYALVVGSDQMWRDDYFHAGFDFTPYLFYAEEKKCKKIAYAVSFGKNSCSHPEDRRCEIERLIKMFDTISVREPSGKEILKNVFHVEGTWVCDPTLLHDARTYIEKLGIKRKTENINEITTYILNQSTKFFRCAEMISNQTRTPLNHIVHKRFNNLFYKRPLCRIPDLQTRPTVENFLERILNARYIITDSYHGMLFSIIFGKQFIVYNRKAGGSERYYPILGLLGLENRLFDEDDNIEEVVAILKTKIDYNNVNARLKEFKELSLKFLKDSLA